MAITWLHISDIHISAGDSYGRDVVLRTLVASTRRLAEEGHRPDVLFATGDIANSGKAEEYEVASSFFVELLEVLELDRSRLFVIPGNHDVDRPRGLGLARTLDSREESDSYFAPNFARPHLTQKQAGFLAWYEAFFAGVRGPSTTSCGPVEVVEEGGVRLGVLPINSALFCQGDDDHAKLWIGRRALDAATKNMAGLTVDLRIALIHHPLSWLADPERSNIRTTLAGSADVVLRGHLHETDVGQVIVPQGELVEFAAGAAYQTRKYPNRAMYVTFDGAALSIYPIRYEDSPTEVWTLDPSLFPAGHDHVGTISLADLGRPIDVRPKLPSKASGSDDGVITAEELIDNLENGDHDKAELRAFLVVVTYKRADQIKVVDDIARFLRNAGTHGDKIHRASAVLEALNRIDPSLISRDLISELARASETSKRMSAAVLLWDRAVIAPHDVPLEYLSSLARPATEDWYVQAPAMAALKQLLLRRKEAAIIFDQLSRSQYSDNRTAAAHALADVAAIDARVVPRHILMRLAEDPDEVVADAGRRALEGLGDQAETRDPRSPFGL